MPYVWYIVVFSYRSIALDVFEMARSIPTAAPRSYVSEAKAFPDFSVVGLGTFENHLHATLARLP
jgi:hypothetical protein